MADFNIEVQDAEVQAALAKVKLLALNFQEPLVDMREYYLRRVDRRFEDQGPNWPDLTPQYAKWKMRQPRAIQKTLQFNGLLRASIVGQIDRATIRFGTNLIYAARQNKARPFLTPTVEDEREFKDILLDHLRRAVE
jgi:phage gpG-like protein